MIVPTQVPFSQVTAGQVISGDLVIYYMKCDATTLVNLLNGTVSPNANPDSFYTVFPAAKLVLG